MYEEIFNDVQKVKDELKKAGRNDIPPTKIFNLLEILKSPTIVAQIFMESKDSNNSDNLQKNQNGTEIEVIEELTNETKGKITVDLTKVQEKSVVSNRVVEDDSFEDSIHNEVSNESDVDNYYTNSDYDEDEPTCEKESKTESPPPILSILKDLSENLILPELPEPSFNNNREAENLEIFEENNNDPNNNNNLEEIPLSEQTRPQSPVAGCSRDFKETDESTRSESPMAMSIEECQPSCSKKYIKLDDDSDSEIEEVSQVSFQVNYEKLLDETETINRLFPDISGDAIFSMLDKNREATNRVIIVLWDLLPKEKPEPNIPELEKKRKRKSESYPLAKKQASPFALAKIDDKTIKKIQEDVKKNEKPETDSPDIKETVLSSGDKSVKKDLSIVKPAQFVYQNTTTDNSEIITKRSIISAPKLILSKDNSQHLAPKRKFSSQMTREISEEGFISEGTDTMNTVPNTVLLQNPLSTSNLKKVKNVEGSASSSKRSRSSDEANLLGNSSATDCDPLWPPFDLTSDAENFESNNTVSKIAVDSKVFDDFAFKNSPSTQKVISSSKLEFLKPNQTQFYQMPSSSCSQTQQTPKASTSQNPVLVVNSPCPNIKIKSPVSNIHMSPLDLLKQATFPISIANAASTSHANSPLNQSKISYPTIVSIASVASTSHATSPLNRPKSTCPTIVSVASPTVVNSSKIDDIPCKDTYYKLRSIFPDIDPAFIKEKCLNPPFPMSGLGKEEQLNMLVEILLADGSNHQILEIREETDVGNKDEQYEHLLGIFPEADPEYLRNFVDENYKCPDNLKNFIQQNLENPCYPTRTQYLEKIKINQQIKDYTTDFSVKKFLQIFPNPVEHFENPSRKCAYKPMANEFLKDVFRKHKVATISSIYRKRNHHLSLTANDLRNLSPDMKGKRSNYYMPTEDIPLLQEMAYIKFKRDIVNYLQDIKKQESEDFKNMKEQGLLLECQCCFSDECLPRKCSTCEDGHIFCHSCILRGTESKIGDGQNHISCFANCEKEFSLSVLQEVLPPTTFSILLQKRQEAEVMAAGLEGLVSCPFCHFASIPPVESKVFKCLNPECMKETCRSCKALNHVPLRCDEVLKEDEARLKLEEKMTEALVRTCYKCQKPFFKEEGCNKMTCVCGASMCYLCSTPLKSGDYKHFNGQGSSNSKLCPLWTDNRRMNAEAVRKIAEVTENELRKKNPNLKFSSKSILPSLPPKTKGPHDDIPNANALPEHVLRIANNQ